MTPEQAYWKAYDEYEAGERLPELEDIIMTSFSESYYYATDIIKDKLPDKMHNRMLLHAMENSNGQCNLWVKNYFNFIRDKKKYLPKNTRRENTRRGLTRSEEEI